jgi:hypothetical protein
MAGAKDGKSGDKRQNRAVSIGEMVAGALGPALKRRGFATRDLVAHWPAIAPTPYDQVAIPDKLVWPRREAGSDGATLFLRCAQAHSLALSHEGPAVAAAINRYFGYVLVGKVKLSATPFTPHSAAGDQSRTKVTPPQLMEKVDAEVASVEDEGLRQALHKLGLGIMNKNDRPS